MGETASFTQFFISIGGGGLSGGSMLPLTKVKDAAIKDERGLEILLATGVRQGAGFRHKEGGGSIDLTVYREAGRQEVSWLNLCLDRKSFVWTYQDEGAGVRESFLCRVEKVDPETDEQGKAEFKVSLKYTKRYSKS